MLIGYVRKSPNGHDEEGMSLPAQRQRIEAYCVANGLQLLRIEEDLFQTSAHMDRPGIQRALACINGGEATGLVVVKLDRLTRNVRDLLDLVAGPFAKAELHSVCEKLDTGSATGRFFVTMMGAMAQWTRETIAENTSATLKSMQQAGRVLGKAPYGYRKAASADGKMTALHAVPEEQAVLDYIVHLDVNEYGPSKIATKLNDKGYKTRSGGRWTHGQIQSILKRA